MENNHDCLVVVQFLYYKSASKHILKSVVVEKSGLGIEQRRHRNIRERFRLIRAL